MKLVFRVGGVVFTLAGVALLGVWIASFGDSVSSVTSQAAHATDAADVAAATESFDVFGDLWMPFAGALLLSIGVWMLRAGFLGVAARYVAGETMPVVKDAASFLTDGEGLMGIGRTEEVHASSHDVFCPQCGTAHAPNATFCSRCGRKLH